MALVRINLEDAGLVEHGTGRPAPDALQDHIQGAGPVVILIHGFKFAPGLGPHCPHDHILSLADQHACWKVVSWPRELGLDREGSKALGIAFGWSARGSIWQAYDRAGQAGAGLARLISLLNRLAPGRPVHILAHSLGARAALSALPHLPAHSLARAVLLAGAEFRDAAQAAMETPAGCTTEIVSVTSRENRPYDRLLQRARPRAGRTIGLSPPSAHNWVNLPISSAEVLTALTGLGFEIAPPQHWICHWSSYLRPGVFALYEALIASDRPMPLTTLRRAAEARPERRTWPPTRISLPRPTFGIGRAAG